VSMTDLKCICRKTIAQVDGEDGRVYVRCKRCKRLIEVGRRGKPEGPKEVSNTRANSQLCG